MMRVFFLWQHGAWNIEHDRVIVILKQAFHLSSRRRFRMTSRELARRLPAGRQETLRRKRRVAQLSWVDKTLFL